MAFKKNTEIEDANNLLLERSNEVLNVVNGLKEQLEKMDRTNKKFLMAATMVDSKSELLEKKNKELVYGVISLLDQIDSIISVIHESHNENTNGGLKALYKKTTDIINSLGIEEIDSMIGKLHNPKLQECVESVYDEKLPIGTVLQLYQRGYIEKETRNVIRCAKVSVNGKGNVYGENCRN